MTIGQLPQDGVFRLRPIEEGSDAAARLLLALESGLPPDRLAAAVRISRRAFDKFIELAREGRLPRGRLAAADILPRGRPAPLTHPLGRPYFRAIAMRMIRKDGIYTGDIEAILVAAQKTMPVANVISEMRKRLKPHGVVIASKYSGRFRTHYTITEGRDALARLIEEAVLIEGDLK